MPGFGRGLLARCLVGVLLALVLVSPVAASSSRPGGRSLQAISHAPWIFLGQVVATEIRSGLSSPYSPDPHSARFTQFQILQNVRGPSHEGETVTLKECAPDTQGPPLCGGLYGDAPAYRAGDTFLIFSGPGKARADGLQGAILLPAIRVPVFVAPQLPPEAIALPEERFGPHRSAPSGWRVDLSGPSLLLDIDLSPRHPARIKKERLSEKYALTEDEAEAVDKAGPVDLGLLLKLIHRMGAK